MKKDFRNKVIHTRKNTDYSFISKASDIISDKLLSMDVINNASTIMLYLDFNNEVKTDYLVNSLIALGKKVLIPITLKESKQLLPSEIKNLDNELKIGTYGIREPKSEYIRISNIEEIDILIVPAVAFDRSKYRLGYGGGFYDRFIELLSPNCITIGIAFDFQIFDSIPKEPHDAQMNFIITETQTII